MPDATKKIVIGLVEEVTIKGKDKRKKITLPARIDTGARINSIDSKIVKELSLGPVLTVKKVKNANGIAIRPVINVEFIMSGKTIKSKFTVTDRSHMKYDVLIGRNVLADGFLIDPSITGD